MRVLIAIMLLLTGSSVFAAQAEFRSGHGQVALIELYTSEGCSSCPPADRFLASLKDRPGLFKTFIPLAFHVDYWDYLGWKDPFAEAAFSRRQRTYQSQGHTHSVYTPQFVINGHEWQGFFRGDRNWPDQPHSVGMLSAHLEGRALKTRYDAPLADGARIHAVWFGTGLSSSVARGENRGRTLHHDFVVLAHISAPFIGSTQTLTMPPPPQRGQTRTGLAVWLSTSDDPTPIQATGGLLPASGS